MLFSPNNMSKLLANKVTTSGTSVSFTNIPASVKAMALQFNGVSQNNTGGYRIDLSINNGSSWFGSPVYVTYNSYGAADLSYNTVILMRAARGGYLYYNNAVLVTSANALNLAVATLGFNATAAVNALKIDTGGANTFDAGSIDLYAI